MKNLIPKAAVVQTPGSLAYLLCSTPHPWAGQVTQSAEPRVGTGVGGKGQEKGWQSRTE